MLQAIRSRASSWVVKILFAVLIVSFAVWGIGDIFRQPGAEATVITVGPAKITGVEVVDQVRRDLDELRPILGGTVDMEQAKRLGIVDRSIEQIVQRRLFDVAAREYGVIVGDEAVRQTLAANPQFRNAGQFDPRMFQAALQQLRVSEAYYVQGVRQDIARIALTDPVTAGAAASDAMARLLFVHRNEKRRAGFVVIPRSRFEDVGTPDAAQLAETLEKNKERFSIPELRRVTAVALSPDALMGEIAVSDADLRAEYEARRADFVTPEKRRLKQILVPDEATAKAVAAALAEGKSFEEVARDVAKMDPAGLDAGEFDRSSVPAELAAVFDTELGKATAPLQSGLGWHVLQVEAITPEKVRPLEEVKDQIADALRRDRALDRLSTEATKIEDALAGGARLEEAAAAAGLTPLALPPLDQRGRDAEGNPVTPLPGGVELVRIAFDTASGETAPLAELQEGGYLIVRVDEVLPERVRPLDDVREAVAAVWREQRQAEAADKLADEILKALEGGKPLAEIAAAEKLEVRATEAFTRAGGAAAAPLPLAMVTELFRQKVGSGAKGAVGEGAAVARLTAIEPVDPAQDPAAISTLQRTLQREIVTDLASALTEALRRIIPVEIDRATIDRLL
ncbi:MAG: SurA N-terminal domain-containing protein [Alphaproteobacteria bacterium]